MTDVDCILDFSNFLKTNNVQWKDTDIETIEDDDEGNRISFYVYFEEPIIYTDLTLLKNRYYNKSFNLKELILKNNELRCKFTDKNNDQPILYY